jgi:NADPH-dependent 2,4-dienoyl-CoA reductase/sulfur reductase-like enzyme
MISLLNSRSVIDYLFHKSLLTFRHREATMAQKDYDLIVIGAGINGLGIVRDAAERGLRVALVEQEDFCY